MYPWANATAGYGPPRLGYARRAGNDRPPAVTLITFAVTGDGGSPPADGPATTVMAQTRTRARKIADTTHCDGCRLTE